MPRLEHGPIDARQQKQDRIQPQDGAVVVFEGVVRDHARGKKVRFLEYHAYEKMALKKLEEIEELARHKFAIREIDIVHRLGRLAPGESSVIILVAAEHRAPAFQACSFAIDTLKKTVPIWKKEFYEDGEVWIEGSDTP
jgi:molybdopterin synthase catalytic subunit